MQNFKAHIHPVKSPQGSRFEERKCNRVNASIQRINKKPLTLMHSCPVRYKNDKNNNLSRMKRWQGLTANVLIFYLTG